MVIATKRSPKKPMTRAFNSETAKSVLKDAGFSKDCTVCGFNNGQFSSIDLLTAVLAYTGKAKVTIATWTAAGADISQAVSFLKSGLVDEIKWVVDRSFISRQPDLCKHLVVTFGEDSIRIAKSHAKFMLIENKDWHVVVETSMNLNKNERIENFAVTEDLSFYQSYKSIVDDIFRLQDEGKLNKGDKAVNELMAALQKEAPKKKLDFGFELDLNEYAL